MIRIIGIQRSEEAGSEFVLLQNQGSMRIQIRGHAIVSDAGVDGNDPIQQGHIFRDDAVIPPGMYVLLRTGVGEPRWGRTKEGAMVFHAFMNRALPVWRAGCGPIHVLAIQHSYVERPAAIAIH
jgi:hypothetical protein